MRHWTKSSIQGLRDFNDFELLKNWVSGLQKGYYNESNWVTNNIPMIPGDAKVGSSTFGRVPLFMGTNRLIAMLVAIGDSSVSIPQIRLKIYDAGTGTELTYASTASGASTTALEMSTTVNGVGQFLSYSYASCRLESSGTYTNSNGVPISRRVIAKVERLDGSTWSTLDFMDNDPLYYLKFIESSSGFNNEKLPYFGQVIPADFYESFNSMIKGDLNGYSEVSGNRYLNYLIPNYKTTGSIDNMLRLNVENAISLKKIVTANDYWSHKDPVTSDVYTCTRLVYPEPGTFFNGGNTFTYQYGVNQAALNPLTNYPWKGKEEKSYDSWYEMKILGNDSVSEYISPDGTIKNELIELFLYDKREDAIGSYFYNIGSSSMLPGYEESATNTLYELFNPANPSTGELPINNVSLSIIKNTLALPFWTEAICNDVVSLFLGETSRCTVDIRQNERFFMELRPVAIGDEDIDTTGLKVKFYV